MNNQQREKIINSIGDQFKKAVKGIRPSYVATVVARAGENDFHEIDSSAIFQLDALPTLNKGEWLCPAIFEGSSYRFIHIPPSFVGSENVKDYLESYFEQCFEPDDYDFNWGGDGQGLRQLIVAYRQAEKVWFDLAGSTGNIPLDRYLSYLKAMDVLYPIEKTKRSPELNDSAGLYGFRKLDGKSSSLRKIPNGIPTELAKCNRKLDRIIERTKGIDDVETWRLIEEVFRAGQSVESFHHPHFVGELARQSLAMDLGRKQPKQKANWKIWVDCCLGDNPEATWNEILDIIEGQGALEYKKDRLKFEAQRAIKLSSFKATVSKLRKKHKV